MSDSRMDIRVSQQESEMDFSEMSDLDIEEFYGRPPTAEPSAFERAINPLFREDPNYLKEL